MKRNFVNVMLVFLAVVVVGLAGCGGGGGGGVTPVATVATEVWMGSSGQGNTNTTLTKVANGTITTTGQWTYNYQGATVTCQISAGDMTITGPNVTLTMTGTATNPAAPAGYQTSPFTLSQTGTMSDGQGSGTFTITFQTTGWPSSISGNWTAQKQSGSGVTYMSPIPTTMPSAPTGVTATPHDGNVSIGWSEVSGATSYNIYWSNSAGITNGTKLSGVTSPYIHSGLTNATTYYYVVTAINSSGESSASTEVSATPQAVHIAPSAPTGVTATPLSGSRAVSIRWNNVNGATSYNIYWSESAGITKDNGTKLAGVTSPYLHNDLYFATKYYYIVTAVNEYGESSRSLIASATTQAESICSTCIPASNGCLSFGSTCYLFTDGQYRCAPYIGYTCP